MFGGADGQTGVIPSNISITRNYILKPTSTGQDQIDITAYIPS